MKCKRLESIPSVKDLNSERKLVKLLEIVSLVVERDHEKIK